MAEREVSLHAGDSNGAPPIRPGGSVIVHRVTLGRLGMPLIDGAVLGKLAHTCRELARYSFLFVLGTNPVTDATSLPANLMAIF
ncbi:hypothetical protein [Streptomyces acidicola]|uniref:hypothetical protein n=1 Tax=Streptomyces acidicola TaxID=2596892 RepID=UPI00380D69F4